MDSKTDDKAKIDATEESSDDAVFDAEDLVAAAPRGPKIALYASLAAATLSLVALVGVVYQVSGTGGETTPAGTTTRAIEEMSMRVSDTAANLDQLQDSVTTLRQAVAMLEQRLPRLAAQDDVAGADIDALERRLERALAELESVPGRVASMERSLSSLRGMSTGARDAWLLAQAEYFLQIANAELELGRNPAVAARALELADERLISLDDPGLTDVRRSLSSELQALRQLEVVDTAGATVTLASLSRIVDTLPVRPQLLTAGSNDPAATEDSELSGTERAMATLRSAFSDIVSVRRTDEKARPLMAPDAVYFLRANLSLQLQAARLALLRGEKTLFEQSLDDAALWLREYYDLGSTPVTSALATINEIRAAALIPVLPDISGSLRLLRRYIAFDDAGRAATPVRPDVSPPEGADPTASTDDGPPQ